MGSSSTFTVGLIKLCAEIKGMKLSKYDIAQLACDIEIKTYPTLENKTSLLQAMGF